jgi:cytochrome c5
MQRLILIVLGALALGLQAAGAADGQAVYQQKCAACHAVGVAGAPKLGDKAAWAPRIAQGKEALVKSVINGKGAMPPRAGMGASDAEAEAAVGYMIGQAQ